MLEIILAKFEVIMASETPSFIPVLVQMYFFLTFKRCSSSVILTEGIGIAARRTDLAVQEPSYCIY